jgi:hypothetical protein
MEKFICDRRVKWRTACSSDTSGSAAALGAAQVRGYLRGPRHRRRELRDRTASRLAQFEYQRFSRLQSVISFPPRSLQAAARDAFMTSARAPA